jgi:hypothetical protein
MENNYQYFGQYNTFGARHYRNKRPFASKMPYYSIIEHLHTQKTSNYHSFKVLSNYLWFFHYENLCP